MYVSDDVTVSEGVSQARLLVALAEHAKSPLVTIAREAETALLDQKLKVQTSNSLQYIQETSEYALQLFDAYTMALSFTASQPIQLSPISIAATLEDVAHHYDTFAKQHSVTLRVDALKKCDPVMAHSQALYAAIASVIQSAVLFVDGSDNSSQASHRHLTLGSHRTAQGIVAGVFTGGGVELHKNFFKKSLRLLGQARQIAPAVGLDSGAGIYIASLLMRHMNSELRTASHRHMQGFGATLPLINQLSLV